MTLARGSVGRVERSSVAAPRTRRTVRVIVATAILLGGLRGPAEGGAGSRFPCSELIPVRVAGETTTLGRAQAIIAKGVRDPRVRPVDATPRQVHRLIDCIAPRYGIDAGFMKQVADCESGSNVRSYSAAGPYYGTFQYMSGTWAASAASYGHAGASPYDGYAQVHVTARKVRAEGWDAWGICA